ncbi:MAG: hypothetical protein KME19_04865 [Microcoleus vaginatus WJT46-NPBG5]|jgi:hypothetical protein|nr:hypothetical protein [Microcoleus vaginatus WJT46-NPBG5]
MSSSNSDIFICEAFRQILATPLSELEEKFGKEVPLIIAEYLQNIPPAEKLDSAVMANHITAFCQKPGNENLYEWFGEIYDSLDEDGLDKLEKKTGDPDDIATAPTENPGLLYNESRDICQSLQDWAKNVPNPSTQENQNDTSPK